MVKAQHTSGPSSCNINASVKYNLKRCNYFKIYTEGYIEYRAFCVNSTLTRFSLMKGAFVDGAFSINTKGVLVARAFSVNTEGVLADHAFSLNTESVRFECVFLVTVKPSTFSISVAFHHFHLKISYFPSIFTGKITLFWPKKITLFPVEVVAGLLLFKTSSKF